MRYVWVGDRVLKKHRLCAWCSEPLTVGYLHDTETGLYYHDGYCLNQHIVVSEKYSEAAKKHRTLRRVS